MTKPPVFDDLCYYNISFLKMQDLIFGVSRNHKGEKFFEKRPVVCRELAEMMFLGKPIFRIQQKGVPPLLLPASVLQLPRCLARIYDLDSHH